MKTKQRHLTTEHKQKIAIGNAMAWKRRKSLFFRLAKLIGGKIIAKR